MSPPRTTANSRSNSPSRTNVVPSLPLNKLTQRLDHSPSANRTVGTNHGVPPILAYATSISTRINDNIVAYRSSGPIPTGLYRNLVKGEAKPKPVSEKAKSSNIGPQNGRVPEDFRLGRYVQTEANGEFKAKEQKTVVGDVAPLELSLGNIKYLVDSKQFELLNNGKADAKGNLRFRQIDHESDAVKSIIYSINLNDAKYSPRESTSGAIVTARSTESSQAGAKSSVFDTNDLESNVYVVSAQLPGDKQSTPIKVLGGIVRDCDIDFITDPSVKKLDDMLVSQVDPDAKPKASHTLQYLVAIDMSPHDNSTAAAIEAKQNVVKILDLMVEINDRKWDVYENLKAAAAKTPGYDEKKWERDNIEKRPLLDKDIDPAVLSAVVVTKGKGSPMQLYQALEINVIENKLRSYISENPGDPAKKILADLDSSDKDVRNSALAKIHEQKIEYSRELIAASFIQHPAECHNEHYTSKREKSVVFHGNEIRAESDANVSKIVTNKCQRIPINPKWIEKSEGSQNAEVWVKHFLYNHYQYDKRDSMRAERGQQYESVRNAVNTFLQKPENVGFIVNAMQELKSSPKALGAEGAKKYLDNFLAKNPEIANKVNTELAQRASKKVAVNNDSRPAFNTSYK